jgi:acyl-CoA dehydrogenase
MFLTMNDARFGVGIQGIGLAERAYQMALRYARERVQGRQAISGEAGRPIIEHADVKRQLLSMRTRLFAMRCLVYTAASWFDHAARNPDTGVASRCRRQIDLMMPVIKAWNTETGNSVCDDAIQVFGGMGFVEETGVAQHYRDSRVTRIYEGTTGIQANDLIGRKVLRDGGAALRELIGDLRTEIVALAPITRLAGHARVLSGHVADLERALDFLLHANRAAPGTALAAAVPFLHLTGLVCAGWRVAEAARKAHESLSNPQENSEYLQGVLAIAEFWFATFAPQVRAQAETVLGSACVTEAPEAVFAA